MSEQNRLSVGVFDSGVGGLTVVRALRAALPGPDIIYLGDTARVPYGSKSARTVERYSLSCQRFLLDRGVDLVLVACNTASANAIGALSKDSPVTVVGAVQPGAQSALAATVNHHIGVIGTLSTVGSGAYEREIHALNPSASVVTRACPLFVPLAEEGWTEGPVVQAIAERYLSELLQADPQIDTLVLGCTHYPLLQGEIQAVASRLAGHTVAVVDSATAMANVAAEHLHRQSPDNSNLGSLSVFVTDATRLEELAPRFLGQAVDSVELIDL